MQWTCISTIQYVTNWLLYTGLLYQYYALYCTQPMLVITYNTSYKALYMYENIWPQNK